MKFYEGENFAPFPIWESGKIEPVKPTRYFSLVPIEIGSRHAESFTSYIARLAEAHCVTPTRLLFRADESGKEKIPFCLREASIPKTIAKNMNGFGTTAEIITDIFSKATGRADLRNLSLLNARNSVAQNTLLKANRAWCAYCLRENLEQGKTIYEKLSWTISCVFVCSVHNCALSGYCPYCRKTQNFLHRNFRVGYCHYCLMWLGRPEDYSDLEINNDADKNENDLIIAEKIEEFISELPKFDTGEYKAEYFPENLKRYIERVSFGSINDFAYITGTWHVTVRRYVIGNSCPSISILADMCRALDIPLKNLFVKNYEQIGNNCHAAITQTLSFDSENKSAQENLECLLLEMPPVSAKQAAAKIGWHDSRLYRKYPELYQKFVEQYKDFHAPAKNVSDEDVKTALRAAFSAQPPPSLQSVFKNLGIKDNGFRYQQMYPWLCRRISRKFNGYRSRLRKGDDQALEIINNALSENPPPSILEISKRIHINRDFLCQKFPLLYEQLRERYYIYCKNRRNDETEKLKAELEKSVKELYGKGIYPSEARVKEMIGSYRRDSKFKHLLKSCITKFKYIQMQKL